MIINIPLQIDEANIEKMINKEYNNKVVEAIIEQLKEALANRAMGYSREDKARNGLIGLVEREADGFLEKYREEVIDKATNRLVEKLYRTKQVKEMVGKVLEDGTDKQRSSI